MRQVTPPRYLRTMLERVRNDAASEGAGVPHVTFETVEAALPDGQFQVLGTPLSTTGNGQNIAVGQQVPVAWKNGKPLVIVDHHAQAAQPIRALPGGGGIVEELLIAPDSQGNDDVWFRNDQQITPLKVGSFLAGGTPSTLQVGWGLSPDSFFVAVGDPTAPTTSFKVHVFTINRNPKRVIGSGRPAASFSYTWQASSVTLHLSTITFDGELYGAYAQFNIAKQVLMDWTDSLEIEFQDMLSKNLLKFKSIVLDEAHDITILISANVESRRTGFGTVFPRGDATHFIDNSEFPTQPRSDGGTWDSADSFFNGPPSSFQQRVFTEADFDPNGTKALWTIDPGVHFFLVRVTSGPSRLWKTMKDPFNFVWRKRWVGALRPNASTALADRQNAGRVLYGVSDWSLFSTGQGLLDTGDAVGDKLSGFGPATIRGQTIKGGSTNRDPVDTSSVGFADAEQENVASFVGTLFDGPPPQSINEQGPSGSFNTTLSGRPATIAFTIQNTWTRQFDKLWRSLKWKFDTQTPVYLGRRTLGSNGEATYKAPATLGIVALVGERITGAPGFTYIPVTVLGGNPTTYETDTFTDGPNGVTSFTWPYRATTLDSITGAEDFTGTRQEWIEGIDVKNNAAHLLAPVFTKSMSDTLTITFGVSNEYHIQWTQVLNIIQSIFLTKISTSQFINVGNNIAEYTSHNFLILRPNQFYESREQHQRFVLAWDTNGVPTLQQPVQTNQAYQNDPKLLGRGLLKKLTVTPINQGSYVAIDDRAAGVNLKIKN